MSLSALAVFCLSSALAAQPAAYYMELKQEQLIKRPQTIVVSPQYKVAIQFPEEITGFTPMIIRMDDYKLSLMENHKILFIDTFVKKGNGDLMVTLGDDRVLMFHIVVKNQPSGTRVYKVLDDAGDAPETADAALSSVATSAQAAASALDVSILSSSAQDGTSSTQAAVASELSAQQNTDGTVTVKYTLENRNNFSLWVQPTKLALFDLAGHQVPIKHTRAPSRLTLSPKKTLSGEFTFLKKTDDLEYNLKWPFKNVSTPESYVFEKVVIVE
ncbi:hypothetical protein DC3_55460 [Deinococcus cellulosilyticus NBRC 106333 = KACC 11606]|uniref:DUF4138 domain-containing protein n=2 Tax=Deinococcus cellulosilyticus TaxID=401558 RepID=A0A511NC16_DEIC1|nr:hypothetical protein DC3_55460 [Deinococcus cellulosilyticus NBRC 106333 = KACC 11606]